MVYSALADCYYFNFVVLQLNGQQRILIHFLSFEVFLLVYRYFVL